MKLYLVRHGQSVGNENGNVQGRKRDIDGGLSGLGKRQAALVAARLAEAGLTVLYSSPLPRATETAQFIADACELQIEKRDWLVELSYGELEGRPQAETRRLYPGVYDPRWRQNNDIPGGESRSSCYARARAGIDELTAAHDGAETACLVTHGEFLSRLVDALLGMPEAGFPRFTVDNSSVTHLIRSPAGSDGLWICRYVGDTSHLRGLDSPAGRNGW